MDRFGSRLLGFVAGTGIVAAVLLTGCNSRTASSDDDPAPTTSDGAANPTANGSASGPRSISSTPDGASTTTSTTIDPDEMLPTLVEGDRGDDVRHLQRMLNNVTGSSVSPDGVFGPETTIAIRRFQLTNELDVTGDADHHTRVLLSELDAGRATALAEWPAPPIGDGSAAGCQVLVVGDSLIAGGEQRPEAALADVGCLAAADAVGGRSLDDGWQCRVHLSDGRIPLVVLPEPEPGNRTCAPSGLELLELWPGSQGDVVVIALGTNDAQLSTDERIHVAHWDRALALTGTRPVVFLTTAARPGSGSASAQRTYSAALRRWCAAHSRCHLADWAAESLATDPASYFDALHLRPSATQRRAELIASVVDRVVSPPPTTSTSTTTTTTTTSTVPETTTTSTTTTSAPTSTTTTSTTTSTTSSTTTSTTVSATSTTTVPPTSSTSTPTTVPPSGSTVPSTTSPTAPATGRP